MGGCFKRAHLVPFTKNIKSVDSSVLPRWSSLSILDLNLRLLVKVQH